MEATATDPHHARRWLILAVIGIAQLMVVLDATIVNIALPSVQSDLGFSDDQRQWVITAYALAFGSLLLLGGRISDLFGRKQAFITGLLGFAVASAIGGAAQSFGVLVGARALQGVFGALLAPAALSLLATIFTTPSERGKAFGVFGAIAGAGGAVGLLLGGALTEIDWRWCLYVNLAFAIPAAVAASVLLHRIPSPNRPKLDLPGTVIATSGLLALVYGFAHAESDGWTDPLTLGLLVGAAVLLVVFVLVQQRVANPLLPLRVVLDRNRGGAFLGMGLGAIGVFGVFLFLTFYMQQTLGFSPIKTGVAFMPLNLAIVTTAMLVNTRLLARTGPRPLIPTGMALNVLSMLLLTGVAVDSSYASAVLPSLILSGVGFGLIFAPTFSGASEGVEPKDSGIASAMVNTSQQVGGAVGTALLSTLVVSATTSFAEGKARTPQLMAEAAVHGYTVAFATSAGIFALGAVLTFALLRSGPPQSTLAHRAQEARDAEAAEAAEAGRERVAVAG